MNLALPIVLLISALLLSGLFAAAETALLSLTPFHLDYLRSRHRKQIAALEKLLRTSDETLLFILSFRILSRVAAIALCMTIMYRLMPGEGIAVSLISGALATGLVIVISELVPRAIAVERSTSMAPNLARLVQFMFRVFLPLRWLVRLLVPLTHGHSRIVKQTHEEYQLRALIEAGEVEGLLNERERATIDNVLDFRASMANEVMLARPEMEAVPDTLTQEEMLERLRATKHSRIPLYHETVDSIAAMLHAKEVLLNPDTDYRQLLRQPLFIPPKRSLTDLLADFQKSRMHLAIVVDEYGGTSGLVTLADLLQRIISAIEQEDDEEQQEIRRVGENRWIVQGDCEIETLNDEVGANVPDTLSRTIGGFVTATLGRFPRVQERISYENLTFIVLKMETNRVRLLRVQLRSEAEQAQEESGEEQGSENGEASKG